MFEGASSGLLGQEDLEEAAAALEPDTVAGVLVWENRWAAPIAVALRRSGGQLVASGRIPVQAILAALDAAEATTDQRGGTMPGLLRGVARTAVVAGTATAVSNRVSRRQAQRWAQQEAYASLSPRTPSRRRPRPPPRPAADPIEQLKELAELRDQGILTDEEFAAQKAKILGGGDGDACAGQPKRPLFGYLLGAMTTSVMLGLVIELTLAGSSGGTSTANHTINPALDIALGALVSIVAFVVGNGRDHRRQARRVNKQERRPTRRRRMATVLSGGSARMRFVVGAPPTRPGASYLVGLDQLAKQDLSTAATVLSRTAFNATDADPARSTALGSCPPEKTSAAVHRFSAWLSREPPGPWP